MIRGVVVHMTGEQHLLADLQALPTPRDACLVCTNLRTTAGAKPSFIDQSGSWFLIPLVQVRFVEIPAGAVAGEEEAAAVTRGGEAGVGSEEEIELDEDFLRRVREA